MKGETKMKGEHYLVSVQMTLIADEWSDDQVDKMNAQQQ